MENIRKLAEVAATELGNQHNVGMTKKKKPKLKIVDVDRDDCNDEKELTKKLII